MNIKSDANIELVDIISEIIPNYAGDYKLLVLRYVDGRVTSLSVWALLTI